MTADEELKDLIEYIRGWHLHRLKKFKKDGLPEYERSIARKRYNVFIQRANRYHKEQNLTGLRNTAKEILFFIDPWEVTVWYALNTKKKV